MKVPRRRAEVVSSLCDGGDTGQQRHEKSDGARPCDGKGAMV
jgi:hypothetical protein